MKPLLIILSFTLLLSQERTEIIQKMLQMALRGAPRAPPEHPKDPPRTSRRPSGTPKGPEATPRSPQSLRLLTFPKENLSF